MIIEWLDRMENDLKEHDACWVTNTLATLGYFDEGCRGRTCAECNERALKTINEIRNEVYTTTNNVTTGLIQGLLDSLEFVGEQEAVCFVGDVLRSVDKKYEKVCDGMCDNTTPKRCECAVTNALLGLKEKVANKTECTCKPKQAISDKTSDKQLLYKTVTQLCEEESSDISSETRKELDNVNHPNHYNTNKYECIDEMVAVFGVEDVKAFCKCNAWKYRYRSDAKNGEEDLKKADWYLEKLMELKEK